MRAGLQHQIDELSLEIRHYPTPIARCDEQLTRFIEERSRLLRLLSREIMPAGGCTPETAWANDGGAAA
jgi:hypothetical protein